MSGITASEPPTRPGPPTFCKLGLMSDCQRSQNIQRIFLTRPVTSAKEICSDMTLVAVLTLQQCIVRNALSAERALGLGRKQRNSVNSVGSHRGNEVR